jgi:hypothetical protein
MEQETKWKAFADALSIALTCAPKSTEIRKCLNGVYCDPDGFVVATDGHVLAAVKAAIPAGYGGMILTIKHAKAIVKGQETQVDMHELFVDSSYIDWRRAIPHTSFNGIAPAPAFSSCVLSQIAAFTKAVAKTKPRKKTLACLNPTEKNERGAYVAQIGGALLVAMPMRNGNESWTGAAAFLSTK